VAAGEAGGIGLPAAYGTRVVVLARRSVRWGVRVEAVRTRLMQPPRDDLWQVMAESLPPLAEGTVVAVSSKVVAIGEGRCLPMASVSHKDALIVREADQYLSRDAVPGGWVLHTLTHGLLAPSAGIDESNGNGHYVLWPQDPYRSAAAIWRWLRRRHGVRAVGVVLTDSRSAPLRRGVTGVALAYCGFRPLHDYRGRRDLFGRTLRVSQSNLADGLAAAAVLVMGEGSECTPLAVITDVPGVRFLSRSPSAAARQAALAVDLEGDLYRPFLSQVDWQPGGRGAEPAVR
jgi:putative folate metabolism gamma-glutamate ligase